MRPVVRRLTTVLLIALVTASGLARLDCAGWLSKSGDRMKCCSRAGDGCADQMSADDCCAAGEKSKHAETGLRLAAAAVTLESIEPVALAVVHLHRALFPSSVSLSPPSPPHLRQLVQLI